MQDKKQLSNITYKIKVVGLIDLLISFLEQLRLGRG